MTAGSFEFLGEGPQGEALWLAVNPSHRFNMDAFLLADFAEAKSKDRCVDLGAGCGILSFLLYKMYFCKEIYGLEFQKTAVSLFSDSVSESGVGDRIFPVEGDLRQLPDAPSAQALRPCGLQSSILSGEPFPGSGKKRRPGQKGAARLRKSAKPQGSSCVSADGSAFPSSRSGCRTLFPLYGKTEWNRSGSLWSQTDGRRPLALSHRRAGRREAGASDRTPFCRPERRREPFPADRRIVSGTVSESEEAMSGTLYVVGTPIGNLSDFSPRAAETLRTVDFIAAEDTRVTLKLLNHFEIKKPMVSYHEHNLRERGIPALIRS